MMNDIIRQAIKTLAQNQECYVAQWILQNPDANISDYTLCHQNNWLDGEASKFWMEKKSR